MKYTVSEVQLPPTHFGQPLQLKICVFNFLEKALLQKSTYAIFLTFLF